MCSLPHLSWSDHSEGTALLQHASGSLAKWGPQQIQEESEVRSGELIAVNVPCYSTPQELNTLVVSILVKYFLLFL